MGGEENAGDRALAWIMLELISSETVPDRFAVKSTV